MTKETDRSLVKSQEVVSVTPFCPVHRALEERDGLVLEVGNDCVACSLHERTIILNMLEPFAADDGSQDSLTVLRRVIDGDVMRSRCVEAVKERAREHRKVAAAIDYGKAVDVPVTSEQHLRLADELDDAATALESVSIQEQNMKTASAIDTIILHPNNDGTYHWMCPNCKREDLGLSSETSLADYLPNVTCSNCGFQFGVDKRYLTLQEQEAKQ